MQVYGDNDNMYVDYSGQRSAEQSSSSRPLVPNNPYIALEGVWRDVKRVAQRSDDNRGLHVTAANATTTTTTTALLSRPVSPMSPVDGITRGGEHTATTTVHQLNLSAICISNILMLEDKHLPSIFIRMYEYCLQQNDEHPQDAENNARLRLLNYMIQRWHETRDRLTFYRDVFKVVGALAKPLLGDHLSVAVESTPINQQHVMRELMRTLRRDTNGRSLGTFLEQYAGRPSSKTCFTFHDLALDLFTREDVIDYESRRAVGGNPVHSFLGEMLTHPMTVYVRRVLISIARAVCRLRLNMSQTVSNKLFNESVPSWAEEDTENGIVNMDQRTRQRVLEARENITRLLMKRKERRLARHTAIIGDTADTATKVTNSNRPSDPLLDRSSDRPSDRFSTRPAFSSIHRDSNEATSNIEDNEEIRTVDTESFLDTCTNYSGPGIPRSTMTVNDQESIVQPLDEKAHMPLLLPASSSPSVSVLPLPSPEPSPSRAAMLPQSLPSTIIDDVVSNTERDLRSLIGSTLNRTRLDNTGTMVTSGHEATRLDYDDGPTATVAEDTLSDMMTDLPPSDRLTEITVSSLTQVDGDIRMLSEYTEVGGVDDPDVKRAKRSNALVAPWGNSSSMDQSDPIVTSVSSGKPTVDNNSSDMIDASSVNNDGNLVSNKVDSRTISRIDHRDVGDGGGGQYDDDELNFDDLM